MIKLIPLAIAALALTAGAASAENTFSLDRARSTASRMIFTDVQADQAGSVNVYAPDGDGLGEFVGAARIEAGTTGLVEIILSEPSHGPLLVVMMNSNHSVAKLDIGDALTN